MEDYDKQRQASAEKSSSSISSPSSSSSSNSDAGDAPDEDNSSAEDKPDDGSEDGGVNEDGASEIAHAPSADDIFDEHCRSVFKLNVDDHAICLAWLRDQEYVTSVEDLVLLVRGGWEVPVIPGLKPLAMKRVRDVVKILRVQIHQQGAAVAPARPEPPRPSSMPRATANRSARIDADAQRIATLEKALQEERAARIAAAEEHKKAAAEQAAELARVRALAEAAIEKGKKVGKMTDDKANKKETDKEESKEQSKKGSKASEKKAKKEKKEKKT